jgi:pimeloyl-ACP methyl ester carboxylesterase
MATTLNPPIESIVAAAGVETELRRGGKGAPLLVIHGEFGLPGWLDALSRLSERHDVIAPSLPGFGRSARPDWIMHPRDYAAWISWFARDLKLPTPIDVIGFSMGGWIAAELAACAPQFFRRLVLVGPMGLKPSKDYIFDYFLESGLTGLRRAFKAPQAAAEFARFWGGDLTPDEADAIEQHREMTCRVAWKPYMHSLTLEALLRGVATPTLIVQGADDAITPLECGERYAKAIPGARLAVLPDCGHAAEMEKPEAFARTVRDFLTA